MLERVLVLAGYRVEFVSSASKWLMSENLAKSFEETNGQKLLEEKYLEVDEHKVSMDDHIAQLMKEISADPKIYNKLREKAMNDCQFAHVSVPPIRGKGVPVKWGRYGWKG
jgi:aromatic ring-opening dioxygenase LigB subunit